MILKKILIFNILFMFCVANASEELDFDKQDEFRIAFERTQDAESKQMQRKLFERPSHPTRQQLKTDEDIKSQTHRIRSNLKGLADISGIAIRSIQNYAKKSYRAITGKRGLPPVANGLFYVYGSGGSHPEVMWYLDGVYDPDGAIVSYEFVYGDGTSQLIPAGHIDISKSISHVYPGEGTYLASVRVTDNDGDSSVFTNSINVVHTNQLPIPKFTLQNNQVPNFLKVDFDSQATDDSGIIRYTWKFGDGSPDIWGANSTTASRTYSAPGLYNVSLIVRDSHRGQVSATTQAYVGQHQPPGGMYPIPLVYANRLSGNAPLSVDFEGDKSFDIGGTIASYEWNFGDFSSPKNISYQANPSYRYSRPGTYYASLKVTDNGGRTNTRYFSIYVFPDNQTTEPISVTAFPANTARTFRFDSNYSSIKAAVPSYYQVWDFGDGSPLVKGVYPAHTYAADGVFTVTLTVYDVRGSVQQVQKTLVVNSDQGAPTAAFTATSQNMLVGEGVTLNTTNTTLISPTTTATWDFGDGMRISGLHKDMLNVSHIYSKKGLYMASLLVTDEYGKSSTANIYINVQDCDRPVSAEIELSGRVGKIPFPMRFDASLSKSEMGPIVKHNWIVYGPTGTHYSQNKAWTATYTDGGERYVSLYVEDAQGNIGYATDVFAAIDPAQIPPENQSPFANIQISFNFNSNPPAAYAHGYFSSDPEGDRIASYSWIFDGSPVSLKPFVTLPLGGDGHLLALRVTDKWGDTGERKVYFRDPFLNFNVAPQASIVGEPVYVVSNEQNIRLPDSQAVEFKWSFGDGSPEVFGYQQSHIYQSPGNYTITLVMTDNLQRTYIKSRTVLIKATSNFSATITAKNMSGTFSATAPEIYRWDQESMATVAFDLHKSDVQGEIDSATWNFGDGSVGFGLNPTYVFQRPGTYNVSVEAVDKRGNISSANIQIVVGTDAFCSSSEGISDCLSLPEIQGHTLPMSLNEWSVSHDKGNIAWSPDLGDTSYAHFVLLDEPASSDINITSAIIVDGLQLKLQKSVLQNLGIDFTKAYELRIETKLADDTEYRGGYSRIHFGIGSINITASEQNIRLSIDGSAGYRRYFDLGNNTAQQITNLPAGVYEITAYKGNDIREHTIDVIDSNTKYLAIDFNSKTNFLVDRLKNLRSSNPRGKDRWISEFDRPGVFVEHKPIPSWPYAPCNAGLTPFVQGSEENLSLSGTSVLQFSSMSPNAITPNLPLTKEFGDNVRINCAIEAGANHYTLYKWKSEKEKFLKTCPPTGASFETIKSDINEQLKKKIKIKWSIRDELVGKTVKGTHQTTMSQILKSEDTDLEQITYKYGVRHKSDMNMWGPKFKVNIPIPKDFIKPDLTISMEAYNNPTEDFNNYKVVCNVIKVNQSLEPNVENPVIEGVAPISNGIMHSAEYNGKQLLLGKFFPLGTDPVISNPAGEFKLSDIYKAKVRLSINSGTYAPHQIDKIKVVMKVLERTLSSYTYSLSPEDYHNVRTNSSKFEIDLKIDAANHPNPWQTIHYPDSRKVDIELIAFGNGIPESNSVKATIWGVTPLFNGKDYVQSNLICSAGVYNPNKVSMYLSASFIDGMYSFFGGRCNDGSLPWGGQFKSLPGNHKGHKSGNALDIRYFNSDQASQDSYDSDSAKNRIDDLKTYLKLVSWAKVASQSPIHRTFFYERCAGLVGGHVRLPCFSGMPIELLDHVKILKLCQWYSIFKDVCSDGAPGYVEALTRYAKWTEANMLQMVSIKNRFLKYLMSDGSRKLVTNSDVVDSKWQFVALNYGRWPDGQDILRYDYITSMLGGSITHHYCSVVDGCGLNENKNFIADVDHFHHIHLE